jgi:hypothetical protein
MESVGNGEVRVEDDALAKRNAILALAPIISIILLLPLLHWAARLDTVIGYPGTPTPQVHRHAGLFIQVAAIASIPSVVTAAFARRGVRIWGIVITIVCNGTGVMCEEVVVGLSKFTF